MASTFVIACPDCGKQIKVTTDVVGKKIRCKECSGVFVVRQPKEQPPEKKPTPKPKPIAAKEAPKETPKAPRQTVEQMQEEDDDGKTPYTLAKDDTGVARCPNCVQELESRDARICLHCGFDMQTRKRAELQAVYEHTGEEKFVWRLPGILCVVGIVILVTVSILCMYWTEYWMKEGWFQSDDVSQGKTVWLIRPGCFMLFNGMLTLFLCYHMGRFAYKRLVVNNLPPERAIEKDDEDDYEDDD